MFYKQQSCPVGSIPYSIKSGDTFFEIAKRNNISLDSLISANPGVDPNRLFIGQIICIPSSTPGPGPTPPNHSCPTLRMGSRGSSVVELQTLLRNAGFNPGAIDGIFGNMTHSEVIAFQRSKGLVQDGIVGVMTWTALGVNCGATPPSHTCPAGTTPYTIKSGDNFYDLARRYNTSVEAIMKANPGVNPNALQIGQIICMPR